MSLKVDIAALPDEMIAALDRGEPVEIEREGQVAAIARPERVRSSRALWEALKRLEPLDPDFARDVESLNDVVTPQESAWER